MLWIRLFECHCLWNHCQCKSVMTSTKATGRLTLRSNWTAHWKCHRPVLVSSCLINLWNISKCKPLQMVNLNKSYRFFNDRSPEKEFFCKMDNCWWLKSLLNNKKVNSITLNLFIETKLLAYNVLSDANPLNAYSRITRILFPFNVLRQNQG